MNSSDPLVTSKSNALKGEVIKAEFDWFMTPGRIYVDNAGIMTSIQRRTIANTR